MTEKKIELKPCPFCGGKAEYETVSTRHVFKKYIGFYIKCTECGVSTGVELTVKEAREAWNRRIEDE